MFYRRRWEDGGRGRWVTHRLEAQVEKACDGGEGGWVEARTGSVQDKTKNQSPNVTINRNWNAKRVLFIICMWGQRQHRAFVIVFPMLTWIHVYPEKCWLITDVPSQYATFFWHYWSLSAQKAKLNSDVGFSREQPFVYQIIFAGGRLMVGAAPSPTSMSPRVLFLCFTSVSMWRTVRVSFHCYWAPIQVLQ